MHTLHEQSGAISHQTIKAMMQNDRWNSSNAKAYNRYRLISRRKNWMKLLKNELSEVPPGKRILEVGAGTGFITAILADAGYNILATDLSSSMLALADRNLRAYGNADKVELVEGDAENLKTQDNEFAAVVSRWVLWTLPDPQKALAEMTRTLAPGGRLVLIDGRHRTMRKSASLRASLCDFLLAGRLPGWRSTTYKNLSDALPRMDAPEVTATLRKLGLEKITSRRLSDTEGDGFLHSWLTGHSWESYLVSGTKQM